MNKPSSVPDHTPFPSPPPPGPSTTPAFSWHWWYVVMAVAGAVSIAVLMAVYVAKLRRKETRFGCVYKLLLALVLGGREGRHSGAKPKKTPGPSCFTLAFGRRKQLCLRRLPERRPLIGL